MITTVRTSEHPGEIEWYVEQRGSGKDIVLVPSGEGDCGSFGRVMEDLATEFRVTTFDTPGFSRSKASPDVEISTVALAEQVVALLKALGIGEAIIYGCSSAGAAVLDIVSSHPDLVSTAVVHEAALGVEKSEFPMRKLVDLDDAQISAECALIFENLLNEDAAAWEALGPAYHERLAVNYVTWIRRYVAGPVHPPIAPDALAGRPISWTIGSKLEVRYFFSNVTLAHQAGIALGLLPCRHFPQVSVPEQFAAHIRQASSRARE